MGGAQFQTGRNSMSPMSAFGRNFIVARSLPRRRPRFARAPCQAFYTEIWRMLDAATESRKMLRRLTSRLHLDLEAGSGKHVRRRGGAQSCRPPPRSRHSAHPVNAAYRCGCLQAAIPILRSAAAIPGCAARAARLTGPRQTDRVPDPRVRARAGRGRTGPACLLPQRRIADVLFAPQWFGPVRPEILNALATGPS